MAVTTFWEGKNMPEEIRKQGPDGVQESSPTSAPQQDGAAPMAVAVSDPGNVEFEGRSPTQTATGPRSKSGKQRSSRNSIKHGIFSEVTVLPGESKAKYRSLLKNIRDEKQPVGEIEYLITEKIASLAWRQRRFLLAEGAEIRWNAKFFGWEQRKKQTEEANEIGMGTVSTSLDPEPGLIWKISNPEIRQLCLELLLQVRDDVKFSGFDRIRHSEILVRLYGSNTHLRKTLYQSFVAWVDIAELSEEERARLSCPYPEACVKLFLSEISKEIRRLQHYNSMESERMKLEILRRNIPESKRLDRLLKYEASLERSFDRALNQLERMQRLRRGQPVAPRIDVNVSM
jgi:hypothetical protein